MKSTSARSTSGASPEVVLELREVSKTFGSFRAVDKLSLKVHRGEILAFLGPNGAGKTTTIDMCEGFLTPDSGSISLLGFNPTTHAQHIRERVGIMLQEGGGYTGITTMELLTLSARYNTRPLDPEWLLQTLGLGEQRSTKYRALSGGQKQRLSLALAIIGRPEVVFLDEPTAGMDAQSRLLVWEIISALKRDGVTVILTTHLMDEAESLADAVVIIDHGQLIAQGTPGELTSAQFIESRSQTDRKIFLTTNKPLNYEHATAVRPLQYEVHLTPKEHSIPEQIAQLARAAAQQNVLITKLDTQHSTLEDVFLQLTGKDMRS